MMRETTIEQHVVCICGHNCERHLSGYTCQEKCDCLEYRAVTDNRAEGEQEHSPLPWRWIDRSEHSNIASRDSQIPFAIERVSTTHYAVEPIADICNFPPATPAQTARQRANAAFIVKACNEHYERGRRIEQLEQIIRDQMSVLRDWRGADNVPQGVRDAMAIRLTELRRVVEGEQARKTNLAIDKT